MYVKKDGPNKVAITEITKTELQGLMDILDSGTRGMDLRDVVPYAELYSDLKKLEEQMGSDGYFRVED
jgi:uncharacterized radical SAM superfamily protein